MRSPFSLQKRKNTKGKTIYYVQFWLEREQKYSTAKSTGQTSKGAATNWALDYLARGQVVTKENVTVAQFSKGFFDPDGDYNTYQRLRNKVVSQNHLSNQESYLRNYILPRFGDTKLSRIGTNQVDDFRLELSKKGLAASTINHILLTMKAIMKWALKKQFIQTVPDFEAVHGRGKEKGILTIGELQKLLSLETWNPRMKLVNLLAYTTGMRLGEIMGLQRKNVHLDDGYILVETSWDRNNGLKSTKSGKSRIIPVPKKIIPLLAKEIYSGPFQEPGDLIFHGDNPDRPMDHKTVQKDLYKRLRQIGISEEIRKRRNITFHSSRHFFNSLLVNARIPELKIQSLTGHQSRQMTEAYYHADDFRDVLEITEGLA